MTPFAVVIIVTVIIVIVTIITIDHAAAASLLLLSRVVSPKADGSCSMSLSHIANHQYFLCDKLLSECAKSL